MCSQATVCYRRLSEQTRLNDEAVHHHQHYQHHHYINYYNEGGNWKSLDVFDMQIKHNRGLNAFINVHKRFFSFSLLTFLIFFKLQYGETICSTRKGYSITTKYSKYGKWSAGCSL